MGRLDDLLARHGEAVTKAKAARIIGVHVNTVTNMIRDGRLKMCAGNTRVSVRSIAHYLDEPKRQNGLARLRKKGMALWVD